MVGFILVTNLSLKVGLTVRSLPMTKRCDPRNKALEMRFVALAIMSAFDPKRTLALNLAGTEQTSIASGGQAALTGDPIGTTYGIDPYQ